MGAAARKLEEVGDVPDHFLADGELVDRFADAAFELAEPLLSRHDVSAARFEHGPASVREASRGELQERSLAHQPLAADEQRARRLLAQRRFGGRKVRTPIIWFDQKIGGFLVAPEAAK